MTRGAKDKIRPHWIIVLVDGRVIGLEYGVCRHGPGRALYPPTATATYTPKLLDRLSNTRPHSYNHYDIPTLGIGST